jgi:DNA helicase HerA-like ATPase
MEEKSMIFTIVGLIIGAMILAGGLYYLIKEKHDMESRKIYGIASAAGGILLVAMFIKLILS